MARPAVCREAQMGFWRQVALGASTEVAALACGVSRPTGYRWFAASGGVMPPRPSREASPPPPTSHGRRLRVGDREEIACLLAAGKNQAEIAKARACQLFCVSGPVTGRG